ncbi:hypothetical protein E1A91_A13G238300v1 [Gossypium mustelinum]|uniref:Uncharacterized protein n=1 Tax=Gossypium mustelinum TaxID=34275 RepID=A0A5D2WM65_GOSMU|nr:hypothetical protein E1A91_A13G238300v1 [Gossypium mustelinum]
MPIKIYKKKRKTPKTYSLFYLPFHLHIMLFILEEPFSLGISFDSISTKQREESHGLFTRCVWRGAADMARPLVRCDAKASRSFTVWGCCGACGTWRLQKPLGFLKEFRH